MLSIIHATHAAVMNAMAFMLHFCHNSRSSAALIALSLTSSTTTILDHVTATLGACIPRLVLLAQKAIFGPTASLHPRPPAINRPPRSRHAFSHDISFAFRLLVEMLERQERRDATLELQIYVLNGLLALLIALVVLAFVLFVIRSIFRCLWFLFFKPASTSTEASTLESNRGIYVPPGRRRELAASDRRASAPVNINDRRR